MLEIPRSSPGMTTEGGDDTVGMVGVSVARLDEDRGSEMMNTPLYCRPRARPGDLIKHS